MNYDELIEDSQLFVKAINTVEDAEGTYCLPGKEYEVIEYLEEQECFIIESEDECVMQIKVDDEDFEIVIK